MTDSPRLRRIASCPSLLDHARTDISFRLPVYKSPAESSSDPEVSHTKLHFDDYLEDAMDKDPGSHFLAEDDYEPYECRFGQWDDSDDEEEEDDSYDLNPNIIDFTLFSDAARHAKETHQPLSPQWQHLIQSQEGAYQRTLQRSHTEPIAVPKPRFLADLPDLTPDNSPHLVDDLDEQDDNTMSRRQQIAHGLKIMLAPDGNNFSAIDDEEDYHLSAAARHHRVAKLLDRPAPPIRRPGLKSSHTLSGHSHSWRRPSFTIPTVREETEECGSAADHDDFEQLAEHRGRSRL